MLYRGAEASERLYRGAEASENLYREAEAPGSLSVSLDELKYQRVAHSRKDEGSESISQDDL